MGVKIYQETNTRPMEKEFEILTLAIYPTPLVESIGQAVTWSVSSKSGSSSAVRRFSELKDSSFLPKRQSFSSFSLLV